MAKQWAQLAVGFWILVSPWLLGFSDISVMKWSNVLCGLALVVMGGWALLGKYGEDKKS